jgi:hypothetical protein
VTPVTGALRPTSTAVADGDRLAAVAAPVRDPLWFVARQLQTQGFLADDGGSPVAVSVAVTTAPLALDGRPLTGPVAPAVEAEPAVPRDRVDTATRVRWATELFRRVADAGVPPATVAALRSGLAGASPLRTVLAGSSVAPVAGLLPDPVALWTTWSAAVGADGSTGTLPALPGSGSSRAAIEPVVRAWVAWLSPRLGPVGGTRAPARWSGRAVGYAFGLTAGQVALTAPDHDGGTVEWHTFDRSAATAAPAAAAPVTVRPSPVRYAGMPERGFWTMEDGAVDLGALATQDPARALLVAFANGYANDWFVVPVDLPDGLSAVASLQVTDTFGTVTTVPAAAALDGPHARFRLWELAAPPTANDAAVGARLLLPAAAPPLEGPAREDVLLGRDEMANLGWLVELTTTDEDGSPVDRYRRWLTLRTDDAATGAARPASGGAAATQYYRLGTTLADFWYPLRAQQDGTLGLATVPAGATDVTDLGVLGSLVPHVAGTAVDDDAIPRTGARVTRVDRVAYTAAGRRVWSARRRGPGTGEASSGLRFDTVGEGRATQNVVQNAGLTVADRTAGARALVGAGRAAAAAVGWEVVGAKGGRATSVVEPATRTRDGWQLHVTASVAHSGVAQRLAESVPAGAELSAWVYVLRGQVGLVGGRSVAGRPAAQSSGTGRWEHLTARASGAVGQVALVAEGGGAEFLVDRLTVRRDAQRPAG